MIKLFITGGTIDCEKIEGNGKYSFGDTCVPAMLEQGRCNVDIECNVLMMKDSLYMTEDDREFILQNCKECKQEKIIITHGTDTITETAQLLGKNIEDKIIVLLGAIIPYDQEKSDALFNLGCAVSSVQSLSRGVYITMNGKIFSWDNVKKNKTLGIFETLKEIDI